MGFFFRPEPEHCEEPPPSARRAKESRGSSLQERFGNQGVQRLLRAVSGGGRALPDGERAFFERRLGRDLSSVRVHDDAAAADSAQAMGARAYTVGSDVVLGAGARLDGAGGRDLLAHELAHVAQQGRGAPSSPASLEVSAPGDAAEHEADRVAAQVMSGKTVGAPTESGPRVQRRMIGEPTAVEAPALSQRAFDAAQKQLAAGRWQQAADTLVDDLVESGTLDRALLVGGRIHYDPNVGEEGG